MRGPRRSRVERDGPATIESDCRSAEIPENGRASDRNEIARVAVYRPTTPADYEDRLGGLTVNPPPGVTRDVVAARRDGAR